MATNHQNSPVRRDRDGFDFDAPQFTDFKQIGNEDGNSLEEYCQSYFDRKTEQIKRKSDEFDIEHLGQHPDDEQPQASNHEHDDEQPKVAMKVASDSDDDDNMATERIANLLPAAEFANTSTMSHRSNKSSKSNRSHNDAVLTHLYSSNKINKGRHALSTEELQLKQMEEKKVELEKLKEKNAKNVAKMKEDHRVFHPIRSTKLTVPITPALRTSLRAQKRMHHHHHQQQQHNDKENESIISHSHSAANSKPKKRKTSNSAMSICADSEREKEKEEDVDSNMSICTTGSGTSTHTVPQSFKLSKSKKRKKRWTVLSSEQQELREIEQHGQFQARKVNPKIFKSNAGNLGILNNVKNKPLTTTTVQPFHFLTEKRARKHQRHEMETSSNESHKT